MQFISRAHDPWHPVGGEDGPVSHPAPRAHQLLSLEQWHAVREGWPRELPTGLMLDNTVDVAEVATDLPRLALIVLRFPKWVDGRAYSQARLLRKRHRFGGEIRACGEVLADMLPLLARTGFDAVVLRADQSIDAAHRALSFFGGHYQGDVREPLPRFARTDEAAWVRAERDLDLGAAI